MMNYHRSIDLSTWNKSLLWIRSILVNSRHILFDSCWCSTGWIHRNNWYIHLLWGTFLGQRPVRCHLRNVCVFITIFQLLLLVGNYWNNRQGKGCNIDRRIQGILQRSHNRRNVPLRFRYSSVACSLNSFRSTVLEQSYHNIHDIHLLNSLGRDHCLL